MRCWRNNVKMVLFEISNSMKPYPSVIRAYTNKSRPTIGFSEPNKLDEVSNRMPPTSHSLAASPARRLVGSLPRPLAASSARWLRSS